MTDAKHLLDQIERGLDGVTPDHERIWLQNDNDAHGCEGRLWCQDKVWPEDDEQGEPTEYVRADLFRELEATLAEYRDHSQPYWEARATAAEATVAALQEKLRVAEEALEYYANPEIYKPHPHGPAFDRRDVSFCARTAIATIRRTK